MRVSQLRQGYYFILACFVCCICCDQTTLSADIRAIIVADTVSPTGTAAARDLERVRHELALIGRYTGLKVHLNAYEGDKATIEEVVVAIGKLPVASDDAVIFYFLGHGYRTSTKKTVWPFLYLCNDSRGLDLSVLLEGIIAKKPRMALVVADCCNNVMDDDGAKPWELAASLARNGFNFAKNFKALFVDFRGIIVVSAAKSGDYAYCHDLGHYYTEAFWRAFREEVSTSNPQWYTLLGRASAKVRDLQEPYYEILSYP